MPEPTPSQTVGPFLTLGLVWADGPYVVAPGTAGAVRIGGRVLDGRGEPVPDAMVETWQADPSGRFDHPDDPRGPGGSGFRGFGRSTTDPLGQWWVLTAKPGPLPGQAPHLDVSVFARGLLNRVVTRIYFPDEEAANASDPVLSGIPEPRRSTLVASEATEGSADYLGGDPQTPGLRLKFDIRLQGDHETVFFAI